MGDSVKPADAIAASDVTQVRIEEFDKRADMLFATIQHISEDIDKKVERVEDRAEFLGKYGLLGMIGATVFVVLGIYFSVSEKVESVVGTAVHSKVEAIEWPPLINSSVKEELKHVITPQVLAEAVGDGRLEEIAGSFLEAPEFEVAVEDELRSLVDLAVSDRVQQYLADTQSFETIVAKQLGKYRESLRKASESSLAVTASNRDQLVTELVSVLAPLQDLGSEWSTVSLHPLKDALRIKARLWWDTARRPDKRVQVVEVAISDTAAVNPQVRKRIADYLAESEIPNETKITWSSKNDGAPSIIAGNAHIYASDMEQALRKVAELAVTFVDECFEPEYPLTWRVQMQ